MDVHLLNEDFSGFQTVGKGHLCCFTSFNGEGFGIGCVTGVGTALRDDFLDGVGAGEQIVGENSTIFPGGEGSKEFVVILKSNKIL